MGLTTNPLDPCLKNGQKEEGQNNCYLVLSKEELEKGFIRPVRNAYVHVGRKYTAGIKILDKNESIPGKEYVAVANFKIGDVIGGTYITQDELDQYNKTGGFIGGCGTLTTMGQTLSETYARDPHFYTSTFCCGCNRHIPVGEFVWDKDNEKVGS